MIPRVLIWCQIAVLSLAIGLGCQRPAAPAPGASSSAEAKVYPTSVAQAEELRKSGASWTNAEIRAYYNKLASSIGPANEQWKKEGLSVEERARRAFQIRHDARHTSRAMMAIPAEVDALRRRDQEKYGNPDGPTFEWLVERARQKGTTGDAIFEGIIASAQRTDEAFNEVVKSRP